jgi:hypothetical protein
MDIPSRILDFARRLSSGADVLSDAFIPLSQSRSIGVADGSFAIVFEEFKVGSAQHTNVILVPNADVTKDADIDQTKIVDLGPLKGATGMQDFTIPAEMTANAMSYHTVVLWDTAIKHAIAAAPLS